MAIPAKPTLTTPPTAPVRGEDRASFAAKANAYVVCIGTNVTDLTAAIDWQDTVFTAVESEAADAAQSAVDAAAEVVLAADQVGLAADQVDLAEAQVVLAADEVALAEAAAAAAVVTANADAWVSGASYSANENAISGIDFGTYRAILTHTGVATDPSADATNWVKISSPEKASQSEAEAGTENTKFLTSLRTAEAIAALVDTSGRLLRITRYATSGSGTWAKPSDTVSVLIRAIGGGGGGADANASARTGGGGGGAGGFSEVYIVGASASYAYVVGAAGAQTSTGGDTTIAGVTCSAGAGASTDSGGIGGAASGGDLNVRGSNGTGGVEVANINAPDGGGGTGGVGFFGGGGGGGGANSDSTEGVFGSGGGGGGRVTNSGSGATGGSGYIEIREYS